MLENYLELLSNGPVDKGKAYLIEIAEIKAQIIHEYHYV